jgi:hypothetical protein
LGRPLPTPQEQNTGVGVNHLILPKTCSQRSELPQTTWLPRLWFVYRVHRWRSHATFLWELRITHLQISMTMLDSRKEETYSVLSPDSEIPGPQEGRRWRYPPLLNHLQTPRGMGRVKSTRSSPKAFLPHVSQSETASWDSSLSWARLPEEKKQYRSAVPRDE